MKPDALAERMINPCTPRLTISFNTRSNSSITSRDNAFVDCAATSIVSTAISSLGGASFRRPVVSIVP